MLAFREKHAGNSRELINVATVYLQGKDTGAARAGAFFYVMSSFSKNLRMASETESMVMGWLSM